MRRLSGGNGSRCRRAWARKRGEAVEQNRERKRSVLLALAAMLRTGGQKQGRRVCRSPTTRCLCHATDLAERGGRIVSRCHNTNDPTVSVSRPCLLVNEYTIVGRSVWAGDREMKPAGRILRSSRRHPLPPTPPVYLVPDLVIAPSGGVVAH
jgi:hypothetical protein